MGKKGAATILRRLAMAQLPIALVAPNALSANAPVDASRPAVGHALGHVTLTGHGYGAGIGMGQWGAFGYAEHYHATYAWILGHFYHGTTLGKVGNPTIKVAIIENDHSNLLVTSGNRFTVSGQRFAAGQVAKVVLTNAAKGTFEIERGTSCGSSSWTRVASARNPTAIPSNSSPSATGAQVLKICRADRVVEPLRGDIQAIAHGGIAHTVEIVPLEQYLRGVVPSQVPPDWALVGSAGPQGRAWGFQALEAQAVAARSFAVAYFTWNRGWAGYANICDSKGCQGYEGMQDEHPFTDAALADTAGKALYVAGTKAVAMTQYSSSDGGYTSGIDFSAVPDLGDSICLTTHYDTCNHKHNWTATIPDTAIQSAFPAIGRLTKLLVTQRNKLGDLGGRVLEVQLSGSRGSIKVGGDDFAAAFHLPSNWFKVTSGP